ncbi:MAG: hypothetical protein MSB10_07785 [Clostridiales bacterium]|nr:hypothetical protein [Clostridiales bacterium]
MTSISLQKCLLNKPQGGLFPRQVPRNGSKTAENSRFYFHSAIAAMRIFLGARLRTQERCKVLAQSPRNLALEQSQCALKALAFKGCGFVRYVLQ